MTREIKFRGKSAGEWHYGYFFAYRNTGGGTGAHFIVLQETEDANLKPIQVMPETIGQFTGLYDKNGKEIYEGDIVRTLVSRLNATKNKKYRNFVIRYDAPHFWNGFDPILMGPMYMEVIGNIYDNPELLKED